jgi:hypothetical protein
MHKLFRNIGLITLVLACFLYTEKLVLVVKEYDDIMIEINEKKDNYYVPATEAIIEEDTIIPGINGKEVDTNKSYTKMRQYGKFEEKLLQYEIVEPENLLKNNLDKFIIKGSNKQEVSLIFLIDNIDKIDNIINILEKYDIKADFFLDSSLYNKEDKIIEIINKNNEIGNLGYKGNYDNEKFYKMDTTIKKIVNQKISYCYTENKDKDILNICFKEKNYTIVPTIIIKDNNIIELKKNLEKGSIISINSVNDTTITQIIKYIESKGYEIVKLSSLLSEEI